MTLILIGHTTCFFAGIKLSVLSLQDLSKAAESRLDLGTRFNDLRLNERVLDKRGQPLVVFTAQEVNGLLSFRCHVCDVVTQGKRNFDSHIDGKKHNLKILSFAKMDPIQPTPPGEEMEAVTPSEPAIKRLLDSFRDAPVIGAEFIVEILRPRDQPLYHCCLCDTNFDAAGIVSCLISARHRLEYLRKYFPTASKLFDKVPNQHVWERSTYDFLESVAMRIEEKGGRMVPKVVNGEDNFRKNYTSMKEDVENGEHCK